MHLSDWLHHAQVTRALNVKPVKKPLRVRKVPGRCAPHRYLIHRKLMFNRASIPFSNNPNLDWKVGFASQLPHICYWIVQLTMPSWQPCKIYSNQIHKCQNKDHPNSTAVSLQRPKISNSLGPEQSQVAGIVPALSNQDQRSKFKD